MPRRGRRYSWEAGDRDLAGLPNQQVRKIFDAVHLVTAGLAIAMLTVGIRIDPLVRAFVTDDGTVLRL
ncbi:MAG: hypothetical protein AAGM36_09085 [Cyanobacteria bacterium J06597_1]